MLRILIILVFTISYCYAQNVLPSGKKAIALFEQSKKNISLNRFSQAAEQLEQLIELDPHFATAYQQLGDIYRKLRHYDQATVFYQKLLALNADFTPLAYFGLGESLLLTGNYEEAIKTLSVFLNKNTKDENLRLLANKYLLDCEFSIEALKNYYTTTVTNLGSSINSAADEYFPRLTADNSKLVYTRKVDGKLEDIYQSEWTNRKWSDAKPLMGEVNSELHSEGAHSISPDGKYLFFTGCNRPDGLGSCDIYVAHWDGKEWSNPHNLGAPVNTSGWEAQPSISADGKTLYFVSRRKGGLGGNDIWKSQLMKNGKWSQPQNLGAAVNTAYDEGSPYLHPDNKTLYFTSNGWPGFGSLDVFVSKVDTNGVRQQALNLGAPINDYREQRAFFVSLEGDKAYFSSESDTGFGGFDIFSCQLNPEHKPYPMTFVNGKVLNNHNKSALTANVRLLDLQTNRTLYDTDADVVDGKFLIPLPEASSYALQISHPGYLPYTQNLKASLDGDAQIDDGIIEVELEQLQVGKSSVLNNIFFVLNSYELLPSSFADLTLLLSFMQINPTIKIEIAGHTDSSGDLNFNQQLSEKRARSVYQYLLENDIDEKRLSYKGYGPTQPIADNDTEDGRIKNRRTDFRIIATKNGS